MQTKMKSESDGKIQPTVKLVDTEKEFSRERPQAGLQ